MTITIEYEARRQLDIPWETMIRDMVEASLEYEKCPYEVEVNVILTDDHGIREINRDYRQIDAPTDVLSFPLIEYETAADFGHVEKQMADNFNSETGELVLGDIVISVDKVAEQAVEYGHSQARELAFLIVHSMLHLFGYDHLKEDGQQLMQSHQRKILSGRGYER